MKEKNKAIFLSILVVATLIIVAVGATFAYFSTTGGSNNSALRANATVLPDLSLVSAHNKIATDLVPVASESAHFSRYPGTGVSDCIDDVGNEICTVYEFTVTNTASVTQTIYVSFVPSQNTFDNMYFAAFNTAADEADYTVATGSSGAGSSFTLTAETTENNNTLAHQATKLTKNSTTPINMPNLTTTLSSGASVTYTILVWLQETGNSQNTEQSGQFKAGVNVTTASASAGVTGVLDSSTPSVTYLYTIGSQIDLNQAFPYDYLAGYGSQTSVEGYGIYFSCASALNDYPYSSACIRSKIEGDIVTQLSLEVVVTPEAAALEDNVGLNAGTYSFTTDTTYEEDLATLARIFGNLENNPLCTNNGGGSFSCEYYDADYNRESVGVSPNGVRSYRNGGCAIQKNSEYVYSYCGDI